MSLKDIMRKDFENVFLNTDEFAETFTVKRNGVVSHEVDGIFESAKVLNVKLKADVVAGDILISKDTSNQFEVLKTEPELTTFLRVYCR